MLVYPPGQLATRDGALMVRAPRQQVIPRLVYPAGQSAARPGMTDLAHSSRVSRTSWEASAPPLQTLRLH